MSHYDLDKVLLSFNDKDGEMQWTVRNAVEGVQIFGGIGSGKTSGSGKTIANKYLEAGFGGLVLTVKPDERAVWEAYCAKAGRSDDLIIVEPRSPHHYVFNFIDYETKRTPPNGSVSQNLLHVLKTVISAGGQKQDEGGENTFWEQALDTLIANCIDLCLLAKGTVTIPLLYEIVVSIDGTMFDDDQDVKDKLITEAEKQKWKVTAQEPTFARKIWTEAETKVTEKALAWIDEWATERLKQKGTRWTSKEELKELMKPEHAELAKLSTEQYNKLLAKHIPETRTLLLIRKFFKQSYITLPLKTKSIIDFKFLGFLNQLIRDPAYSLFCDGETNFTPENCLDGKIILLNLPVKHYHNVGRNCQILFKYIWQRAMEARDITANGRPVFLWADEAQNFLHEYDADCQATARSSRIATVYLSQNMPNYYASMSGDHKKSEYKVQSFMGTLATKIFHANADVETNEYASKLIGEKYRTDLSRTDTLAETPSMQMTARRELARQVRPEMFTPLKTGGQRHGRMTEAYIHVQGMFAGSNRNHTKVAFTQD